MRCEGVRNNRLRDQEPSILNHCCWEGCGWVTGGQQMTKKRTLALMWVRLVKWSSLMCLGTHNGREVVCVNAWIKCALAFIVMVETNITRVFSLPSTSSCWYLTFPDVFANNFLTQNRKSRLYGQDERREKSSTDPQIETISYPSYIQTGVRTQPNPMISYNRHLHRTLQHTRR